MVNMIKGVSVSTDLFSFTDTYYRRSSTYKDYEQERLRLELSVPVLGALNLKGVGNIDEGYFSPIDLEFRYQLGGDKTQGGHYESMKIENDLQFHKKQKINNSLAHYFSTGPSISYFRSTVPDGITEPMRIYRGSLITNDNELELSFDKQKKYRFKLGTSVNLLSYIKYTIEPTTRKIFNTFESAKIGGEFEVDVNSSRSVTWSISYDQQYTTLNKHPFNMNETAYSWGMKFTFIPGALK